MKGLKTRWLLVAMACLTLCSPLPSIAEDNGSSALDGSSTLKKALDYAACAVSIGAASTGWGIALAVLACGNALNEWWTE
jgi:hypothetical protein